MKRIVKTKRELIANIKYMIDERNNVRTKPVVKYNFDIVNEEMKHND